MKSNKFFYLWATLGFFVWIHIVSVRIGYKKVKTLIVDPKKLFLKWASVELKSSLHLTPCLKCPRPPSAFDRAMQHRIKFSSSPFSWQFQWVTFNFFRTKKRSLTSKLFGGNLWNILLFLWFLDKICTARSGWQSVGGLGLYAAPEASPVLPRFPRTNFYFPYFW